MLCTKSKINIGNPQKSSSTSNIDKSQVKSQVETGRSYIKISSPSIYSYVWWHQATPVSPDIPSQEGQVPSQVLCQDKTKSVFQVRNSVKSQVKIGHTQFKTASLSPDRWSHKSDWVLLEKISHQSYILFHHILICLSNCPTPISAHTSASRPVEHHSPKPRERTASANKTAST